LVRKPLWATSIKDWGAASFRLVVPLGVRGKKKERRENLKSKKPAGRVKKTRKQKRIGKLLVNVRRGGEGRGTSQRGSKWED